MGDIQTAVSAVEAWSQANRIELNADTCPCKEMIIDFKKNAHNFLPLVINGKELPVSNYVKILGVSICANLKWNEHKRFYFIILLKRANVPYVDILNFYFTAISGPVLQYSAPRFHHALPQYVSEDIERVQKRLLSIVNLHMSYSDCLAKFGLITLHAIDVLVYVTSFVTQRSHVQGRSSRYCYLKYNLRCPRTFATPRCNTNRFKNTFIPSMCIRSLR